MSSNIFIVGVAKSGTTSLCDYLSRHESISKISIKEPNFFCSDIHDQLSQAKYNYLNVINRKEDLKKNDSHAAFITSKEVYDSIFEENKIRLDASTNYMISETSANEIYDYDPKAKIIICLRNPLSRAFSHYKMDLRTGMKLNSFDEEVNKEINNMNAVNWANSPLYVSRSLYFTQVKRFFDLFPNQNIKVIFFENLVSTKSGETLLDICNFLKLTYLDNDLSNSNVSSSPRFILLNKILYYFNIKSWARDYFPVQLKEVIKKVYYSSSDSQRKPTVRNNQLIEYLNSDLRKLEELGIDTSIWEL